MVRKNTFGGNIVLLIFIIVLVENYFVPNRLFMDNMGNILSINIMGYYFLFSDIIIFSFIFFSIIYLIVKMMITNKINLGPKPAVPFTSLFIFLFFLSLLFGIINSNNGFFSHFREMGYTLSLYIIFLNIKFSNIQKKNIFTLLLINSIIFTIISFFSFFYPSVFNFLPPYVSNENTLIFAILLFNISFSKIIYEKFSILWSMLALLSFLTLIFHIFIKGPVFGLFISIITILLMVYSQKRIKIKLKYIIYIFLIIAFFLIWISQDNNLRNYMINTARYRYLNIGRGKYMEQDLSTGRFDIWKEYLLQSAKGFGIAPQGFGHEITIKMYGTDRINKGAHNIIVYYAYHVGYISAICLLILILMFFIKGFRILKNIKFSKNLLFKEYEIVGSFAFVISQFAMNMGSLRIEEARYAWTFWFLIVFLIKEWNKLSSNYEI